MTDESNAWSAGRLALQAPLIRARFADGVEIYLDVTGVHDLGSKLGIDVTMPAHFSSPVAEVLRASSGSLISLDAALGCVPGGNVCDPQVIADSLRELVAAEPSGEAQNQSTRNTLFLPSDGVEFRLRTALQMLYDETVSYITLNKLGGMDNQCMRLTREALNFLAPKSISDEIDKMISQDAPPK